MRTIIPMFLLLLVFRNIYYNDWTLDTVVIAQSTIVLPAILRRVHLRPTAQHAFTHGSIYNVFIPTTWLCVRLLLAKLQPLSLYLRTFLANRLPAAWMDVGRH